ncbi:hypothetical protein A244_27609, partial [Pseudomonas syringae pv. actinidiae ICMP 18807]
MAIHSSFDALAYQSGFANHFSSEAL